MRINSNRFLRLLFACVALGLIVAQSPLVSAAEQKVALVIGNSAYPTSRLRNPVNDAKAMAGKLRTLGFDVILKTDSTQREMTRAISQFGQKLVLGSVGLFYYAGHGMQVRGKNFLVPIDAEIETEGSVSSEAVDVDQVLNQLGPARLSMVILDACRNNPFERKFRSSAGGGLAQIDAPTGTMLAYATAPGKVASDGNGSNGLYTEALLNALDKPGLKVEDVFKQVRIHVLKASDSQQTPWESSSMTGEFYFRPDNKVDVTTTKLDDVEKGQRELLQEMAKLKAELLAMRERSSPAIQQPAPTPPPVIVTKTIPATPNPRPIESKPEEKQQVAVALPTKTAATMPSAISGEWAERIRALEQAKGNLTFSKAMALLLNITSDADLTLLVTHEAKMKSLLWPVAYALGINREGKLIWGVASGWGLASFSKSTSIENCSSKEPASTCKVIMDNGDFKELEFLQIAKSLTSGSLLAVRTDFLGSITKMPVDLTSSCISGGGNGNLHPCVGFASKRD